MRFETCRMWIAGLAIAAGLSPQMATAAAPSAVPFKLGTFRAANREYLGLVIKDSTVVDIAAANAAWEQRNNTAAKVAMPVDMKDLISRYDRELGPRLRELAAFSAAGAQNFALPVGSVKVLPPVRPAVILNAGANYPEHAQGIVAQGARGAAAPGAAPNRGGAPAAGGPPAAGPAGAGGPPRAGGAGQSAPGYWERAPGDARAENPYLFLKSPTVVVGANDDVIIPRGRVQIDWECEFVAVVGRKSKNVSVKDAGDYIFGYSIEFDVSDRGGRGDRKMGGAPDWVVQKNHDTFGPIGPYIVPKEFMPDPMNVRHYFTLNGEVMQDSNTSRMEYNIWEMMSFASNLLTLSPGDLIAMGSPAGTNSERENPRWMKAGDVGVCVVEGVGEQHHKIVAQQD
jgi:2-keto-4-pentenoate hydratase/2-oxohepta-3-ene-1,7-dioic acid hydratase in catechol pathway